MYLFLTTYNFYPTTNILHFIFLLAYFLLFLLVSPMGLYMMIMNSYVQLCFENNAFIINKGILN